MSHGHPTVADLALIGAAFLSTAHAALRLGHTSPASTLDYMTWVDDLGPDESAAASIVRDYTAWTSGRKHLAPGCRERLDAYLELSGWKAADIARSAEMRTSKTDADATGAA